MASRLSIIVSFVLATLLTTGGVELFCRSLDQALTVNKQEQATLSSGSGQTINKKTTAISSKKNAQGTGSRNYTIITKRSLFGKIPTEESETVPEPSPVLEATSLDLILLGTISGEANIQRAIIQDKKKRTQDIYYQGDAVGPALIKEIFRGKVILTVGSKDEVLLMQEPKSPPSTRKSAVPVPMADTNKSVVEEPLPIVDEDIDDLEEPSEPPNPELGGPTEYEMEAEADEPAHVLNSRGTPRKIKFKKKNSQVTEP